MTTQINLLPEMPPIGPRLIEISSRVRVTPDELTCASWSGCPRCTGKSSVAAIVEATQVGVGVVKPALDGDPELRDYIIGLDANRHTWRTIPKPVRWRLVQAHLRSIWRDCARRSHRDISCARCSGAPLRCCSRWRFTTRRW